MKAIVCTVAQFLLLVGAAQTCKAEVICLGPNNVREPSPDCRTPCQTDDLLYSTCSNFNHPESAWLQLHIRVRQDENISVTVTARSHGDPVQHEKWLQPQPGSNCTDRLLHVKIQGELEDHTSAVVTVETQQEVRNYSILFMEKPSFGQPRDWIMSLGYILTAAKPGNGSGNGTQLIRLGAIQRLTALVSRPVNGSRRFRRSQVRVELLGSRRISTMPRELSICSGVWCTFEMKQFISQAKGQRERKESRLKFWYVLPTPYVNTYDVASPQQLNIEDRMYWHPEAERVALADRDGAESDQGTAVAGPSQTPEPTAASTIPLTLISGCIIGALMVLLVAALLTRAYRVSSNRSSDTLVVVAMSRAALRHYQPGLQALQQRMRTQGCRVIIERTLDVRRLRAPQAGSRVFILLEDEEQMQLGSSDLELLTTPEKSKYIVLNLRGGDAMNQLYERVQEEVVSQREAEQAVGNKGIEQDV